MLALLLLACATPSRVLVLVTDTTRVDLGGAPWPAWAPVSEARIYTEAMSASSLTLPSTAALLSGQPASEAALGCWAAHVVSDNARVYESAYTRCGHSRVTLLHGVSEPARWRAARVAEAGRALVEAGESPLLVQPLGPHIPLHGDTLPDELVRGLSRSGEDHGIGGWWQREYGRAVADTLDAVEPLVLDALDAGYTVVWTSDHGEALGDGGRWGHGRSLDDEQVRVPLAVLGGGVEPGWDESPTGTLAVAWTVTGERGCDLRTGAGGCPAPVAELQTPAGWVRR